MRDGFDVSDYRRFMESREHVLCPVCGGPLPLNPRNYRNGQFAHFLSRRKAHYRRYGKEIIDSIYNGVIVCSLRCNNAVELNYGSQPVLSNQVRDLIMEMEENERD